MLIRKIDDRSTSKFTSEVVSQIKELVAQSKSREEIARLIGVTTGTLIVTCSRLGVILRRPRLKDALPSKVDSRCAGSIPAAPPILCSTDIKKSNRYFRWNSASGTSCSVPIICLSRTASSSCQSESDTRQDYPTNATTSRSCWSHSAFIGL